MEWLCSGWSPWSSRWRAASSHGHPPTRFCTKGSGASPGRRGHKRPGAACRRRRPSIRRSAPTSLPLEILSGAVVVAVVVVVVVAEMRPKDWTESRRMARRRLTRAARLRTRRRATRLRTQCSSHCCCCGPSQRGISSLRTSRGHCRAD